MINKWFFSKNAKVIGPLTFYDAKTYLAENPDAYGWNATFTQWKPVSCIDEFSGVLPPVPQVPAIPKEISDRFRAKQKSLDKSLINIDINIENTELSIEKMDKKVAEYKQVSQGLGQDITGAINNIEVKTSRLKQQLTHVKDAVTIASQERLDVVNTFNRKMNANNVFMPSCNKNTLQDSTNDKVHTLNFAAKEVKAAKDRIEETIDKMESQKTYRGVPVEVENKREDLAKKPKVQRMYRGQPVT